MTAFRTCSGCVFDKEPCFHRDTLKAKLSGLGITSVRWKCKFRSARFIVGDPVWALTSESYGSADEGGPLKDDFAGFVIRSAGAKALVWIEPGTPGRERGEDGVRFEPSGNGFCKIPLSRLKPREAEREAICPSCEWPASKGHQEGYSCAWVRP